MSASQDAGFVQLVAVAMIDDHGARQAGDEVMETQVERLPLAVHAVVDDRLAPASVVAPRQRRHALEIIEVHERKASTSKRNPSRAAHSGRQRSLAVEILPASGATEPARRVWKRSEGPCARFAGQNDRKSSASHTGQLTTSWLVESRVAAARVAASARVRRFAAATHRVTLVGIEAVARRRSA